MKTMLNLLGNYLAEIPFLLRSKRIRRLLKLALGWLTLIPGRKGKQQYSYECDCSSHVRPR